jgi:hypothetical protein
MRAAVVAGLALVAGLVAGGALAFTVQDSAGDRPAPTSPPEATTPTTAPAIKPLPETPATPVTAGLYLAWAQGGLPPTLAAGLAADESISDVTTVRRDPLELVRTTDADGTVVDEPGDGFVIPIDAMAFDPATYPAVMPAAQKSPLADLADDELLLGATSARLRRIGTGGTLTFATGATYTVAGVVDDEVLGGAEVGTTYAGGVGIGVDGERYVLFTSPAERAVLEATVRELAPAERAIRLRGVGETPFLRNGDAVLPQVLVKERFGEFTYRSADGDDIEPDPAWVEENIVTETVPLLGRVRCHRAVIPALRGALGEIERENLGHLLPAEDYLGCFVPRTTRYDENLSRHSWGIAFDLNYPKNPTGQRSVQDERMVEILLRWGFTWGGEWLVPDPAHFEYLRPPVD